MAAVGMGTAAVYAAMDDFHLSLNFASYSFTLLYRSPRVSRLFVSGLKSGVQFPAVICAKGLNPSSFLCVMPLNGSHNGTEFNPIVVVLDKRICRLAHSGHRACDRRGRRGGWFCYWLVDTHVLRLDPNL